MNDCDTFDPFLLLTELAVLERSKVSPPPASLVDEVNALFGDQRRSPLRRRSRRRLVAVASLGGLTAAEGLGIVATSLASIVRWVSGGRLP